MKTWLRCARTVLLCHMCGTGPLYAGGLIFEGKITDSMGKAVAGAQVQLTDPSGKLRYETISDIRGVYRFPTLPPVRSVPYRATISHIRFKPLHVDDFATGAKVSSPGPKDFMPGQSVALFASTRILSRDFLLIPSAGTPQLPAVGPVDPNLYEYYFQRALLLLSEGKKREAVEFLKLYAQAGSNPRQVMRSIELILENQGQ